MARRYSIHPDSAAATSRTVSSTYTNGFLTGITGYPSSISYHPNGQVNQIVRANGTTDTYTKDPQNQLRPNKIDTKVTSTGTVLWSSGIYSYDGAGNVVKMGSSYFLHDGVSRIRSGTLYTGPGGGATGPEPFDHAYDGFGNLQSMTSNGVVRNTPTSAGTNRLTGSVGYDAAGALTAWNGASYSYDQAGMMWRMVSGTEDWLYIYTADDERIWSYKPAANLSRWTLRGLDQKVLREYQNAGGVWTVQRDYIYRGGDALAAETPTGVNHLHPDHLGTVRAITNSTGTRIAYHAYYPFGEEATSPTQNTERMKFTGHERDLANTGSSADDLDYMHARFYNPLTGRFTSFDAAGGSARPAAPQTWNRYSYVGGNPLKYVDPDGNERAAVMQNVAVSQLLSGEISTREYTETLTRPGPAAVVAAVAAGVMAAPILGAGGLVGGQGLLVKAPPIVTSPALAGVVNQLFKAGDRFVGGTANAIRIELATGRGVAGRFHIQAGLQRLKGLQDILQQGGLSGADTRTALRLSRDLQTSLQPLLNRLNMTADQLRKALSSGQLTQDDLLKLMKK